METLVGWSVEMRYLDGERPVWRIVGSLPFLKRSRIFGSSHSFTPRFFGNSGDGLLPT